MGQAKTIAFLNGKGGCGKTTSLYHLCGVYASQGKKVLIIDFDKQMNATRTFLMNTREMPESTIYDLLINEFEIGIKEAVLPALFQTHGNAAAKYYGVDVIHGDVRLSDTETLRGIGSERLRRNYKALVAAGGYDLVLADMPPSSEELNKICLGYLADYVLMPFSSDLFSVTGYSDIKETVERAQETNLFLKVLGIFLARYMSYCLVDRYIREQLMELESFIDVQIPASADVREAVMYGRPISFYRRESNSRRAYERLAAEIEDRINQRGD